MSVGSMGTGIGPSFHRQEMKWNVDKAQSNWFIGPTKCQKIPI